MVLGFRVASISNLDHRSPQALGVMIPIFLLLCFFCHISLCFLLSSCNSRLTTFFPLEGFTCMVLSYFLSFLCLRLHLHCMVVEMSLPTLLIVGVVTC
jgi:hypothetical protein